MTTHDAALPTVSPDETRFGIAGDWHGNWRFASWKLEEFAQAGIKTIFQLGDFGIWPGPSGDEYLGKIRKNLEVHGQTLYVTLGNHEDYDQVDALEEDELGLKWPRHNIALFPRPFWFRLGNLADPNHTYRVLSLGGAPSIDFKIRTPGRDWWGQEMITTDEVLRATEGGHVDIMLAHDAPSGGTRAVQDILVNNPMGWDPESLAYAAIGRSRMTDAVAAIKPDVFLHGHYHVADSGWIDYGGEDMGAIHSLNPDGLPRNIGILDLDNIYNLERV